MGLRTRFERAIGLGPSDEPRPMSVETRHTHTVRPVVSTPGARVRLSRDGWEGELTGVLVMCQRRGVPVELTDGPSGVWLDGSPITALELMNHLGKT